MRRKSEEVREGNKVSAGTLLAKTKEGVRVEQQPHSRYSAKSFRCSSSSATMTSIPLQFPALRD